MAFITRPCRLFIDGESYADFEPRSWANGWLGPSPHIYAERGPDGRKYQRAPGVSLKPGAHRLDVIVDDDGTDSIEWVVGVADAASDLWLPFAMASKK